MHAKVLRSRPDVNCSIHTHQPLASACTLFGKALDVPYPPLWKSLGKRIQLVGYAPSGSGWLAGKLGRAIRSDHNVYLMRNHGVLCCGADIETTLTRLEDLETFCRDHLVNQIKVNTRGKPESRAAVARLINALTSSSSHALSPQTFSETQS